MSENGFNRFEDMIDASLANMRSNLDATYRYMRDGAAVVAIVKAIQSFAQDNDVLSGNSAIIYVKQRALLEEIHNITTEAINETD